MTVSVLNRSIMKDYTINYNNNDYNSKQNKDYIDSCLKYKTAINDTPLVLTMNKDDGFEMVLSKRTKRSIKNGEIKIKSPKQIRADAFNTLSCRNKLTQSVKDTKVCIYSIRGLNCPRKVCFFKHSDNKKNYVSTCYFGTTCIHVNNPLKLCRFKHPNETMDEYKDRIKKYDTLNKSARGDTSPAISCTEDPSQVELSSRAELARGVSVRTAASNESVFLQRRALLDESDGRIAREDTNKSENYCIQCKEPLPLSLS